MFNGNEYLANFTATANFVFANVSNYMTLSLCIGISADNFGYSN